MRETLILQDLLRKFRNDPNARNDFTTGNNGAVKLDSSDLALIDKLIVEGFIDMDNCESEESFAENAHRAADHWVSTVDGKPKQFLLGITYERVRRVVRSIQDSRYFLRRFDNASTNNPSTTTQSDVALATAAGDDPEDVSETNTELAATERPSSVETLSGLSVDANAAPPSVASNDQETFIPVLDASAAKPSNGRAAEKNDASPPPPSSVVIDPNSLPEELQTGAFSFLQDSELEELGLSSNQNHSSPLQLQNGMSVGLRENHPSHIPQQQPQQHQPLIPVQPPAANMVLINPIMSLPGMPVSAPGQHPVDHIVTGGVTPPMFPFPFQNPAVANLPPIPAAAAVPGMNPVQQLVKTLHANHLHMMQNPVDQPSANVNGVSQVNGGGQPMMMPIINGAHLPHRVQMAEQSAAPNGQIRFADPAVDGSSNQGEKQGSPVGAMGVADQMTISEWDPAVGTEDAATHKHNNHKNNHKRETSTESSSGGDRRTRQNGNESGYNGSRRRYMDRPNNAANGGGSNYNGSRMHRNGGDGENGPVSSFRANMGKSQHQHRMSGSGGAANGGGGGSTFYRNNDPSFYGQNGVGGGGMKPVRQGYNQAQVNGRGAAAAGGNRN